MATGYVKKLKHDYGFIKCYDAAQGDLFFHKSALRDGLEFSDTLLEMPVEFELVDPEPFRGPRAQVVRPLY